MGWIELFVTALGNVDLALCAGSIFDRCAEIFIKRSGIIAPISPVDSLDMVLGSVGLAKFCNTSQIANPDIDRGRCRSY